MGPMNTTERIFLCGTHPVGDFEYKRVIWQNNPICPHHWQAAIDNNPGGPMPVLNPDYIEEIFIKLRHDVDNATRGWPRWRGPAAGPEAG